MDHFILPPGAQHYITVPYKCIEPYDNGDFATYPERKGWTIDDIEGKDDYGHRKPEEIEMFFQSWLFFGVLVQVFKVVDIEINVDDFIDRDKGVVTTCKFPELMEEYAMVWKKTWPDDISFELASAPNAIAVTKILSAVFRIMRPYCYNPVAGGSLSVRSSPLSPEIVVSIVGLAITFYNAGRYLYMEFGTLISYNIGTPLLRSLLEKKWCPFHVTAMQTELRLDAQYYVAALPGLPETELQRHSDCTGIRCMEKPVDEDTYVLKHAIEASSLPYISISHVWSDGMGNPKQNALPACLLESIQRMVNGVDFPGRESDHEHVGFWMDTLCIPVDPKHDAQRKATIIKMRQIYQEASAVLVLESQLQTVLSTVPIVERCWTRRLWTYQEGGLSKWLCIQFHDKSLVLHKIHDEAVYPNAPERRGDNMISQTRSSLAFQFIDNVQSQFGLLQGGLFRWVANGTIDTLRWIAFLPMASSYSSRMTTRQSDESLCLASVLHLDLTPLVQLKGPDGLKSKDKETRRRADRALGDERMAFPRLPLEGFRWAPRTYLGELPWFADQDVTPAYKDHDESQAIVYTDKKNRAGLLVRFPLVTFNYHPSFDVSGERFFMVTRTGDKAPNNDIVGRYFIEPVGLHHLEGFSWAVNVSYRLVMEIPRENRVVGKTILAVFGPLLPWKRKIPRIRHERLMRVTPLPLQSSSDGVSVPTFEGTEVPECSLIIA
ncbi:hypothetical protein Clacol_005334 [Clathrus columnatus]|uniref:Heterokaryon incompatibility domain-containing protein n=1 Tax=Clathrus columnatus TaxID=1419009 RepID=A0AAV5AC93_9AGAM|nr:hypothetical protein Clacol_005334 [Clathrus columnatus]